MKAGELDLLYAAPERASQPHFRELLEQANISLFAIDEAHCVSEWGHDFRPDYRLLQPRCLIISHTVPRLALTATADRHTRGDILIQLGIEQDGLILAGFDRPNIRYAITPRKGLTRPISRTLSERIPGSRVSSIHRTRNATEKLADQIAQTGRSARAYHAGLPPEIRQQNQADFVASEDMVMCCNHSLWHGHRQTRCALRRSCGPAQID